MGTPPLGYKPANPTWQITNFQIIPTNIVPEIIQVRIDASLATLALGTSYSLYNFVGSTFTKVSAFMKVGFTAAQFKSALSGLSYINSYGPEVTRLTYDANGAVTSVAADIAVYEYNITIVRIRPESDPTLPDRSIKIGINVTTNQTHSPGLGGTFQIKLDGSAIKVYDTSSGLTTATISPSNDLYKI
jgi:hypothetical protein